MTAGVLRIGSTIYSRQPAASLGISPGLAAGAYAHDRGCGLCEGPAPSRRSQRPCRRTGIQTRRGMRPASLGRALGRPARDTCCSIVLKHETRQAAPPDVTSLRPRAPHWSPVHAPAARPPGHNSSPKAALPGIAAGLPGNHSSCRDHRCRRNVSCPRITLRTGSLSRARQAVPDQPNIMHCSHSHDSCWPAFLRQRLCWPAWHCTQISSRLSTLLYFRDRSNPNPPSCGPTIRTVVRACIFTSLSRPSRRRP